MPNNCCVNSIIIATSAPASGRSPWMEWAIRFPYTQAVFRGTNGCMTSPFPYPGLLRNFGCWRPEPRQSWNKKAPSKPFSKLLQNSRVLLQAFPQTNRWRFCAISRGYKVSKRPLMLSKFFASGRPLFAALPDLTHRWRVSSRSSYPDRENFEPNRQSGFWEEISRNSSEPSLGDSALASGHPAWMKAGLPLSDIPGRFRRTSRLHHVSFLYEIYLAQINMITICFLLVRRRPSADPLE